MNLHHPKLAEKVSDLALYLLVLLVTFLIWMSLTMPTAKDQQMIDSQVVAHFVTMQRLIT